MSDRTIESLSPTARELAGLMPGVYLSRDQVLTDAHGGRRPLLGLLEVLAEPLDDLREAIRMLLDDSFVERASPDALPLLADLVGARLLGEHPGTNRAVVARAIHWRRRKGTLRTLEQVLSATSGWDAEVDEAFRSLLQTQDVTWPVLWRGRTALLTDPIAVADPLSRRARNQPTTGPGGVTSRSPLIPSLGAEVGDSLELTLRRLGAVDAGRHAASPRTIDFAGWVRPEIAVIRTSRMSINERDRVPCQPVVAPVADRFRRIVLDPRGGAQPLAGLVPVEPLELTGGLTEVHEPSDPPAVDVRRDLLTPTDLAADPEGALNADLATVWVDGAILAGPPPPTAGGPPGAAPVKPVVGHRNAVIRFADEERPSGDDEWTIEALAVRDPAQLGSNAGEAINPVVATTTLRHGVGQRNPEVVTDAGRVAQAGASLGIRMTRSRLDRGAHRDQGGQWSDVAVAPRLRVPASDTVRLVDGGQEVFARLERDGDDLVVATWRPGGGNGGDDTWQTAPLDFDALGPAGRPDVQSLVPGPALMAVAHDTAVLVIGPTEAVAPRPGLAVWQISDVGAGAPAIARLDDVATPARPDTRRLAGVCITGGLLVVHGGERDGQVLADLWQLPLTGPDQGAWRPRLVRNAQHRTGGRLVAGQTDGVVTLLGGASTHGTLDGGVYRADLNEARPRWEARPTLPVSQGKPGVLWAHRVADGIEAIVWADRTRPRSWLLGDGDAAWRSAAGGEASAGPNPPAEGDVVLDGGAMWVVAPPPLPPSEIIVRLGGGEAQLCALPAVDLTTAEDSDVFLVDADGSTRRWFAAGDPARPSLRLGAGRAADTSRRSAGERSTSGGRLGGGDARMGLPGRLSWQPLLLRQASLGVWDQSLVLADDTAIWLDPRLGRLAIPISLGGSVPDDLLPDGHGLHPAGDVEVSYRVGRPTEIGAGFGPPDRQVPTRWQEPDTPPTRTVDDDDHLFALPPPPDVDESRPGGPAPISAFVDPLSVDTGAEPRRVATLPDALPGDEHGAHIVGVVGSPRLAPTTLVVNEPDIVSIFRADEGGYPHITAEAGTSLTITERLVEGSQPDAGPQMFLAGLSLAGAVRLALSAGVVDLRWCDLGSPGGDVADRTGVRVAGAGRQDGPSLSTIPEPRIVVRLVGCRVGVLEVPPWAVVVAAGCTFDAGSTDDLALAAAGARLRLRDCTVRGRTAAGWLEASSCAFAGTVRAGRPDLGWLRHCVLPAGGNAPLEYASVRHPLSLASVTPANPRYLVLDDNNGADVLSTGERDTPPGAHADRRRRSVELTERTQEFLPLGMVAHHLDRTTLDLYRMDRRTS